MLRALRLAGVFVPAALAVSGMVIPAVLPEEVTPVEGGYLYRDVVDGRQVFEYHYKSWSLEGNFSPRSLVTDFRVRMGLPVLGPVTMGTAKGDLRKGLTVNFSRSVAKGGARLYLKGGRKVWAHVKAETITGKTDHDVHLFDLERASKSTRR